MELERTHYEIMVQGLPRLRYIYGLLLRWWRGRKWEKAVRIARKNGAQVGEGVVMPIALAKRMNSNVKIGNHVILRSDNIDTRAPLTIGDYVIITGDTEIITCSHDIDSPEFTYKQYGLVIEDYVWMPKNITVLPSCRKIGYGAVISSGSVVVKDVEPMTVVGGNPAKEFKKRKCVHSNIYPESFHMADLEAYKKARKERNEK